MKLWNKETPFVTVKKMMPQSVYRRERIKVALNSVSSHRKVTDQNDTQHKYSLYLTKNFHSYCIYKMSAACPKYLFKMTDPSFLALFQLR